jgi:hypothetical protein
MTDWLLTVYAVVIGAGLLLGSVRGLWRIWRVRHDPDWTHEGEGL